MDIVNWRSLRGFIGLVVALLFLVATLTQAVQSAPDSTSYLVYLPLIQSPEILQPSEEVTVQITPDAGLNASTFNVGSFVITNSAENSQRISKIRLDLGSAFLPDMVFDPNGIAGDTTAKNLQVDSNASAYQSHAFLAPHDGGFDILEINFTGFGPGESFTFSLDVDPTSIKGTAAPGPNESGSVSGLELVGTAVTVTLADGTLLNGEIFRQEGSNGGGDLLLREGLLAAPTLELVGSTTPPATVMQASQTVRVTGEPGRTVRLLVVEGGLFTTAVPGGGFDLDPFEANSALKITETSGIITFSGTVDLPVTLSRSQAEGGLNYIVAVQEDGFGNKGMVSAPIVLEYVTP
ncbi:hypothetical protein [Candidatus Leptofilum sp.]|uniref:hypothetical protein n=1 Tax=Candidatus Leptofilum sp. TaxID=3241576 RepID=UPI003B5AA69C